MRPANLTNDGARNNSLAWSPDGQKIAYDSIRDGNREIYVVAATARPASRTKGAASRH